MDKITDVLINWQVLLISFAVFAVLGVLRAVGTKKDPKTGAALGGFAENTWFKRFLPIYPYLLSVGLVFIPGVPLPELVGTALAVKILFAIYAAWLSDKVYQIIKKYLDERGIHIEAKALAEDLKEEVKK
jgi:hypothetical protein